MDTGTMKRTRCGRFALCWLMLALVLFVTACSADRGATDFGEPEAGRRVYDRSGTLSGTEVRDLERRAATLAASGAPTIIYLRARNADYDATAQDARNLMAAWDVQSAPNARDGVVIFLNLKPSDTRHGQVALYAGARHYQEGNLPERELRRIFEDEMRPLLTDGQLAAGIGAGLDALTRSLAYGPAPVPAPGPLQRTAGTLARLPLNLLAVLGAVGAALLATRIWRLRPARSKPELPTLTRPSDLAPALAGALAAGRIQALQLAEATLLDLARRGALVVEPTGRRSMQVRPLDATVPNTVPEKIVWATLARAADANGIVSAKALRRLQSRWGPLRVALRAELLDRGWYDPAADARRRPLYAAGGGALVASAVAAGVAGVGQEPWGVLAAGVFLASGLALLILGYSYPATTDEGERAAAPWRAYRAGLVRAGRDRTRALDLDAVLPDTVALGAVAALDRRMKEASKAGYAPAWFVGRSATGAANGFYPVWVAFHSSAGVSASSGSGAATGGGGAGGSF